MKSMDAIVKYFSFIYIISIPPKYTCLEIKLSVLPPLGFSLHYCCCTASFCSLTQSPTVLLICSLAFSEEKPHI